MASIMVCYGLVLCIVSFLELVNAGPVAVLDQANVTGVASGGVNTFLGIPFAKPPIGDLRFRLPVPIEAYVGAIDATSYGPACPQQLGPIPDLNGIPPETVPFLEFFAVTIPDDEDCLTINVIAPNVTSASKLPVVAWIYGGGFETGGTIMYNGTSLVQRSIALRDPIIYVSMNYRVSAFGFLAGNEVKNAGVGNIGLHDQRLALRWIQKYISSFGGDPEKVTIWGESAGAASVSYHMLFDGGHPDGLFRGAFMQSGSPLSLESLESGQPYYDNVVQGVGCRSSNDTLACLRAVPYATLKAAVDATPTLFESLELAWAPRIDGVLFSKNPQDLVIQRKVARVPIVNGDCDDEGTLFTLAQRNITTDAQLKEYLQASLFPDASEGEIDTLMDLYPEDPASGSPFGTGENNVLTPQFKRLAALQGDLVFQSPRRLFLSTLSGRQDIYSFIHKRMKDIPILGSFHGTDLVFNAYAEGGDMQDYLIRFVAHLNPNGNTNILWPRWTVAAPWMLSFEDGSTPLTISTDTFRLNATTAIGTIVLAHS